MKLPGTPDSSLSLCQDTGGGPTPAEAIAPVRHTSQEALRAFAITLGDLSHGSWEGMNDTAKVPARQGTLGILQYGDSPAEAVVKAMDRALRARPQG